jgi:hypothetical protein
MIAELFGKVTFMNVPLLEYRRHADTTSQAAGRSHAPVPERLWNRVLMVGYLVARRLSIT